MRAGKVRGPGKKRGIRPRQVFWVHAATKLPARYVALRLVYTSDEIGIK